jgi:glycosyltransferase involved in cell wall biosynthesis
MKLLVIGHSYVTPFAQAKYAAMKALEPDTKLKLVVPHVVHHQFGVYRPQLAAGITADELAVVRAFGGRSHMTYLLDPVGLRSVFRDFDPTHVHIEEDPHAAVGVEAVWMARSMCPRAIISFFLWDNLNRVPAPPLGTVKRHLMRFGLSRAKLVVCGNEVAKALLPAKGYGGPAQVIPQVGLAPEDYARTHSGSTRTIPTIGFFGRLVEEKGLVDLLSALELLRDLPWKLTICGSGPLRPAIEGHWQSVFGSRLTCMGAIPHNDVSKRLADVDIFVLPSFGTPLWQEQFGLTLAQAMLAGCACIGSSSGAIPDTLAGCGLIFPERDVQALSGALRTLIESQQDREKMGKAAKAFAVAHYTSDAIARRYLGVFEAIA